MEQKREVLTMTRREIKRFQVIEKVIKQELKQVEATEVLSLSSRQLRRLVRRVRAEGEAGVIHGLRGKASTYKTPGRVRENILKICRLRYEGFGPTLACEMLQERNGIKISKETLRQWMIAEGLWQRKKFSGGRHLRWRERKGHRGEMVQVDGSHHDWLEGRGPWMVLMGWIDDATGRVYGRFYEYEGTIPALDSLSRYIKIYGIPSSVYLDRHTTYKNKAKETTEDQLNDTHPLSQFEVACAKLQIKVIHATSPQAKGRIERLFKTLQDRLVKELRLVGAKTLLEANEALERFLVRYNARFNVPAKESGDLHRSWDRKMDREDIFSIHVLRTLRNDNTVVHEKQWFQVLTRTQAKEVDLRQGVNGRLDILGNGIKLKYQRITGPALKPVVRKTRLTTRMFIPVQAHPWRRPYDQKSLNKWQKRTLSLCSKADILTLP